MSPLDSAFAGAVDWIHERATVEVAVEIVRRYLEATAERLTRQSHIEQWQLQPEPQQPRLVSRYGLPAKDRRAR